MSKSEIVGCNDGAVITNLLSTLKAVRKRGTAQWSARCPAHDDRHPSLSLKELADGRILMHCFAGCSIQSILDSLGLTFESLFPETVQPGARVAKRRLLAASQALELLDVESLVVMLVARDIVVHRKCNLVDFERVKVAYARISAVRDEVNS